MTMPIKILIVEDHRDAREILKIQIQVIGYEVVEATNGEEALEKALAEQPDLIIMDIGLPGINGVEATTRLKGDPKTAAIPVVAYTAWPESVVREKAERAKVAAFLTKPTGPRQFKQIIEKLVRRPS